jgi:hypothetical protein
MMSEDNDMSTSTTLRLSLADYNRMIAEDAFPKRGRYMDHRAYPATDELAPLAFPQNSLAH